MVLFVSLFNVRSNPLISSENNKELEKKNFKINKSYLKQLPANDYIIGAGDVLKIIISRDYPELTSTTSVNGEGLIYLPKLKKIYVNELTINEITSLLNDAYREFVKFPSVEVNVVQYRPIKVLVEGEVGFPGLKILNGSRTLSSSSPNPVLDNSLDIGKLENQINNSEQFNNMNLVNYYFPTVFDAIQAASGVTEYSNLKNIQIIRKNSISNGGGKVQTNLNFQDFLEKGDGSQNIRIYDSDIIKVSRNDSPNSLIFRKAISSNLNPRYISVFVTGRVERPGYIKISRASVLTDAIDVAGGVKTLKGPVKFLRFNNDGSIDKRKFRYLSRATRGSFKNPVLRNGDLIVVDDSLLNLSSELLSEITAPFLNIFTTYSLIEAISN